MMSESGVEFESREIYSYRSESGIFRGRGNVRLTRGVERLRCGV